MSQRLLWKLVLTGLTLAWALWNLLPYSDRPIDKHLQSQVTASKSAELNKLIQRAAEKQKATNGASLFVALKKLANEEHIDLTTYFPDLTLDASLKTIEKRNDVLLDHLLKDSQARLKLGLDLRGGVAFTLEAPSLKADSSSADDKDKLSKAVEIISKRVNELGVAEPIVRPIGGNRIEVQLPAVSTRENPEVGKELKKPARLEFRLVHPQSRPMPFPFPENQLPAGYVNMRESEADDSGQPQYLLVKRIPDLGGDAIKRARVTGDQFGKPQISMVFTSEGGKEFGALTSANIGERLGIVLDDVLLSAPTIKGAITTGEGVITGNFTPLQAQNLASGLNNPLDVPLEVKEQYEVGPSLATDAISSGIKASIIGTALVCAFMITFYATGGLVAVISLAVNIVIILGVMANIGATMTLPGLAGIVLTIGMAVDANILIFERMREEIAEGKSLATSNRTGFLKALTTILDAHFVQLIICGIMIWLGTGPIQGFGFTLLIGVLSTLFSVLITGHMIMEALYESAFLQKMTMRRMLKDLNVDFVKYGKPAAIGSVALVIVSFGYVIFQGDKIYGIDFAGGDQITASYTQKIDGSKIGEVARLNNIGEVITTYSSDLGTGKEQLKLETAFGKSEALLTALQKAFPSANLVKTGQSQIGATIGSEIKWNAVKAVGASMIVILIYIAFRFEIGFGIGAMASTLHDILMNIGIFVLTGHQFSAPMVAAILCVAGYSINETVVVFDRIREELKQNPNGSLREVVNNAIRKVFARTIMTASTTLLAALALWIFGGGQLHDIAFTFLVGIVTSTFSAIFIAAQIFYWWHKGDRRKVEEHKDIAPKYEWVGASKASR